VALRPTLSSGLPLSSVTMATKLNAFFGAAILMPVKTDILNLYNMLKS
jgi:hypothetical protein